MRCDTPGWVALAVCRKCGHRNALPYDRIVKRFGEAFDAEMAMVFVRCSRCGATCPEAQRAKLCEPGCGRQRG